MIPETGISGKVKFSNLKNRKNSHAVRLYIFNLKEAEIMARTGDDARKTIREKSHKNSRLHSGGTPSQLRSEVDNMEWKQQ